MRKTRKLASFILALTIILSTISLGMAQGLNESDIRTGFYVRDENGNNIFIDIYTYLNNKDKYFPILNQGLDNVLFVHQNGTGATLKEILNEIGFRELVEDDFVESYKDASDEEVTLNPKDALYSFTAELNKEQYHIDEEITLTGKAIKSKTGLKDIDITIKAEDIDLIFAEQLKTDDNGYFEVIFQVPENTAPGIYKLVVKANNPVNKFITLDLVIVKEPVEDTIPEDIIEEIANKIKKVYEFIDRDDKVAINEAKLEISRITYEQWDIILKDILTDELVAKFEDQEDAKVKLKTAIEELAEIQYSVDATNLTSNLMDYAETHLPTFRAIFGDEESAEVLFSLFKDIIANIPEAITLSQGNAIAEASNEVLIPLIEEVAKSTLSYTLNLPEYEGFKGRLSGVGLSVNDLLGVRSKLAEIIDSSNKAQIYLINAYARSQSKLEGPIEIEVGETVEYNLTIFGRDVSTIVTWVSDNEEVAKVIVDEKVELKGLKEGTTTIWIYRGDPIEFNWIRVFELEVIPAGIEEVDKSQLQDKINEVNALVADEYTEGTWTILQAALEQANIVIAKENATQEEVDNVLTELINAINGLVKKATESGAQEQLEAPEQP